MRTPSPPRFAVLLLVFSAARCLHPSPLRAQTVTYIQPGQQQQSAPQYTYTTEHLNAVVVSTADGKPVGRVLVTSTDRRMAAMTDSEGKFSFDFRRADLSSSGSGTSNGLRTLGFAMGGNANTFALQLQVRKPGYITNTVTLSLPALQPDTPEPTLQIKIAPAGTIIGHVEPDSGELPSGIQVQLHRKAIQNGAATWQQTGGGQINSRGEFRFADLTPGDYKLSTSAWTSPDASRAAKPDSVPGLTPAFYPDAADLNSAGVVHVGPAATVAVTLVPHSTTFYRVTVPIAGADGTQGANIMLLPSSGGLNLGYYSQSHTLEGFLPPGSYNARVTTYAPMVPAGAAPSPFVSAAGVRIASFPVQPRQSTAIVHFNVGRGPVHVAPVTAVPAVDIPVNVHRDFTNPQSGSAFRPIRLGAGGNIQQMPPVSLYLESVDTNQGTGAGLAPIGPDDSEDSLKLQNVTQGVYHVRVQSTMGDYVASASCGTTDLMHDPLTVGAAGSGCPIEVTLRDDPATVTGTLATGAVPQTPQNPADAGIIFVMGIPLDQPESNPVQSAMPWQGKFQLGAIPPGRYLFIASRRNSFQSMFQDIEYRNPDVLRDLTAKGIVVTLSAGQKAEIQVPLQPEEGN